MGRCESATVGGTTADEATIASVSFVALLLALVLLCFLPDELAATAGLTELVPLALVLLLLLVLLPPPPLLFGLLEECTAELDPPPVPLPFFRDEEADTGTST